MERNRWKVDKEGTGWIVVDDTGTAESDAVIHRTRAAAQAEADKINADAIAWEHRGLADAPHMDAF